MRRAARFLKKRAARIFCFVNRITVYKSIIHVLNSVQMYFTVKIYVFCFVIFRTS